MKIKASYRLQAGEHMFRTVASLLASDPENVLFGTMEREMRRIRGLFPKRITWGALSPAMDSFIVGSAATKQHVKQAVAKEWEPFVL